MPDCKPEQNLTILSSWSCGKNKLTPIITILHRAQGKTWLPVSTHSNWCPFAVFQKRMHRSAVPPPDARRPLWWGDQAMALTAAVCSVSLNTGCWECWFHTKSYWYPTRNLVIKWSDQRKRPLCRMDIYISIYTWLSFPPEASSLSSFDHLSPQTCSSAYRNW